MRRLLLLAAILLSFGGIARANQAARGWCEDGGQVVITSGLTSSTLVQQSFPSCTVTVFVHGGGLATIYSDNNATPTPLANPFTAQVNGQWSFYSSNGRFDIQLSGAGFPSPVTYSDVSLNDPGNGGIVFGVFAAVPFSPTPVFNAATASIFSITLTGNVTSSTVTSPVQNGQVIEIYICQDAVGGRTFTFPSNFTNTSFFTIATGGNVCTPTTWWFSGTSWQPFAGAGGGATGIVPASLGGTGTGTPAAHGVAVAEGASSPFNFVLPTNNGQCLMSAPSNFATTDPSYQSCPTGSGGTSVGPLGTIQEAGAVAGTFAAAPEVDIGGAGTLLALNADWQPQGPNPYVDVRKYGVRALVPTATPAATGITVTITGGSATATVSTSTCAGQASSVCFVNGDGVVIPGAGTAHSMSTPTGVTVTPSLAAAGTGTGLVVNGPTGATTYNYQVMAVNKTRGLTAASTVASTTTGAASLGRQSVNNSTLTRSGNTVTVTTSSAHGFVVGCLAGATNNNNCGQVYIAQTSDDTNWGGWFAVQTVPDTTHYTLLSGMFTQNGAPTSATGGVSVWFNVNHITWTAVTGAWQYCIYGRTGGSLTWIGCSRPTGTNLSDLTFDDFGSPLMDNFKVPGWMPAAPPSSATNNNLVTTISSGAGTTTLTLAAAATATVTNGIIRFDNEPNILTAANAAANQNGTLFFPTLGPSLQYVVNSFLIMPDKSSVSLAGSPFLNDTVQAGQGTIWTGDTFRQGATPASFSQGEGTTIGISEANPGIYVPFNQITNWKRLNFFGQGLLNGGLLFFGDQVSPITFEDVNFTDSTGSADYMGIGLILRGDATGSGNSSFVNMFRNVLLTGGPSQVNASTDTPQFYCNGCGLTRMYSVNMNTRGIFYRPVGAGGDFVLDTGRMQGGLMPTVTYYGGGVVSSLTIRGFQQDTTAHCLFDNMNGASNTSLVIDGAGRPQGVAGASAPLVCGFPIASITAMNQLPLPITGQNTLNKSFVTGFAIDSIINTAVGGGGEYLSEQFNSGVQLGQAYSLFVAPPIPAAPTAAVSTGGSITLGNHVYEVIPVWFNGGEGGESPASNTVSVTSGNQTVTVTWTLVTPTPLGYDVYQDGQLVSRTGGDCTTYPQYSATTTSAVITSFVCGASNSVAAGGPAGIHMNAAGTEGQIWGDFYPNSPNNKTNALPSFNSSGKLIATPCVPTTAGSLCDFSGSAWALFAGNSGAQAIFEESAAGVPSWVAAPLGSLVGTGQSNTWTTGIQDFSAATAFRPKDGTTAALPATCSANPMDVYIATDAQPGRNWYFCTATNVWTQQVNTGVLGLNTYSSAHTLLATESWANFTATATATIPHLLNLNKWVVYNASASSVVTLAPDSGNITLNGVTAATATIQAGQGVEVACDLTNCFAWGLGGSGSGSGTVASCTVNGPAYYTAATTVNCVTPFTTPAGVPYTLTSTPSGGVSQPPALSLPGIVGRAVSGTAATDTILSTDCNPNRVEYVGSVAVAVTLPTAVTLGVPKCVFKLVNTTVPAQTVTITPTTWTINGNATLALTFGQQLWVYVDPNSTTNWVADQTDLFGNVSGGAVPASAKLIGTNSSSQLIAAALSNTHLYVGSAGNLPVDVAASGDVSLANTGAFTVLGANGGTFPASAAVLGTNSSKQPVAATAHGVGLPLQCADTSGSGSAQVCNTTPTFTPVAGDSIIYTTTTASTGAALTVNVNSLGAKSVAKWQTTTTLAANDIRANTEVLLTYDGTNWELATVGNAPAGGGGTPCTVTANSLQYNNAGAFGCVTEFTYASSTVTASSAGKLDLSAASVTAGFKLPSAAAAAPTAAGILSYDTTNNKFVGGNGTNTSTFTWLTAASTSGFFPKFSGTQGLMVNSLCDEAITTANAMTCTDTAGVQSPKFISTGTTAGFIDFPQGTTSSAVAPCNTATSICEQAPTAVTSYLITKPGAAPNIASYKQTDACASASCTESFHPVPVLLTVASDFTTAANTSLQTITGLSTTMPASKAVVASFHCSFNWTQATGTAAVAFGIQGATTAPTSINANATSFSNTTAETTGTLNGLNTTTATAVVSVAPSAITTIWKAEMDGTIEAPSNASPTVVNWMTSTATSGDAVTVKRGSYCLVIFQ